MDDGTALDAAVAGVWMADACEGAGLEVPPLDAQTRQIMGNLLLDLWQADRKAVLFVTHDLEEAIALADRVVVMSAGPAAHIVADRAIDLPRPREINEIRLDPKFHALQRALWNDLREEVLKTYQAQAGGAA